MLSKLVAKSPCKAKLASLGRFWYIWLGWFAGNRLWFKIIVYLFFCTSWFLGIAWPAIVVVAQTTDTSQITINLQGNPNAGVHPANDQATTTQGQTFRIDVSNNDMINSFLDRTSIGVVNPPSNGTAIVVGFFIDYTPNPGFVGQDTFTYRICNTQFDCGQAVVTLQVTDSNSNHSNNNNNGGNNNNTDNNQNQNQNNSGNNNSASNTSQPLPPGSLLITAGVTRLSVFLGFGLLVLVVVFLYRKRNKFRIIFTQQSNSSNVKTVATKPNLKAQISTETRQSLYALQQG